MEMGNYQQASIDALKSIDADPKYYKGYSRAINCFITMGNLKMAETYLKKFGENVSAEAMKFNEGLKLENLKQIDAKIEQNYIERNFCECLKHVDAALKIASASSNYQNMRVECLIMLDDIAEAEEILEEDSKRNPSDPNIIFLQGLACYHDGYLVESIEKLEAALRIDPDFTKAQKLRIKAKKLNTLFNAGAFIIQTGHEQLSGIQTRPDNLSAHV